MEVGIESQPVGSPKKPVDLKGIIELVASIATLVVVSIIGISVVMSKAATPSGPPPIKELANVKVDLKGATTKGAPSAKVVVIEYSDFQCPFCSEFVRKTLPQLEKDYVDSGKVLFAFRNLPLSIHPFATKAASNALCAGRQGKFWEMHDLLFDKQGVFNDTTFPSAIAQLRLDPKAMEACTESEEISGMIKTDSDNAAKLEVRGTPSFQFGFMDGGGSVRLVKEFSGAKPLKEFVGIIDSLLSKDQ